MRPRARPLPPWSLRLLPRHSSGQRRRLPHGALLLLAVLLAGVVIFLTWPARASVFCEQLPELAALAVCAATLLVFCFRALAGIAALGAGNERRIAGGAAVLAGLAFFLSAHFIAQYRKPCVAVQQQLHR